jgi:all-trans-retinol 13,14-reductase
MKYDVVIIGSGISSLTCGALLSKKGKSVLVLEQHPKPGGYLHCFNRFGERFDTGAHYVGAMDEGQAFHTLLTYLGVLKEGIFVPMDPDGFDVFKYPDMEIQFPKGYARLIERLSELFPEEREGIQKYFARLRHVAENFPTYGLKEEPDLLLAAQTLDQSLAQVVEPLIKNPRLKSVLYCYCALHGVEPTEVPFGMHAIMTDSFVSGPAGLAQGGDALADSFVERIRANGGDVRMRTKVASIETKGNLATAVITEKGERFEAEWIISGAHPRQTFALLNKPELFSPAFRKRMDGIKESGGIFGLYAVCKENVGFHPRKNYFYMKTSDPEQVMDYGFHNREPHTVFVCPANRMGDGKKFAVNIHAAGPIDWFTDWRGTKFGKRPTDYEGKKAEYADHVLNMMDRFQPGFKASVEKFATSTPLSNLHWNGSEEGSSYGIYHSIQNTGVRALGPRTHVPNLLLTGQSTLFPGLMGSSVSGLRTTGHILGIKPVIKELRQTAGLM